MPVQNYELLNPNTDVTTTKTMLHEAIPVTGSIVSGTYGVFPNGGNIKNYTHGMFQSVYDYPYLSSSANHIFDITVGYDESSAISASTNIQNSKKVNMYNQFAQVLLGYTGSSNQVKMFENDLTLDNVGSMRNLFFVNFSRLLTKDQVKPGSFSISLGTGSWADPFEDGRVVTLTDASASVTQGTNKTVGGDYGVLYSTTVDQKNDGQAVGVVFYEAGVVAITGSVFGGNNNIATNPTAGPADFYVEPGYGNKNWIEAMTGSAISGNCDALRHRIQNISFNNTTAINSTIYFCRVPHNKYNYSANPTYTSGSKIGVKNKASDSPVTYITTVGLYNSNNELLAVAKLSEPLRKDPQNEITLRLRLDY